ncbi:MAG: CHASE2 domain-containing protein, partial [Leptolyngbyaceae cyanobacterium SM1_3_5]|nr:CHASE2 domain-containing protein [Leptolyngbyaceae cyanobacterium SM1_3_5]
SIRLKIIVYQRNSSFAECFAPTIAIRLPPELYAKIERRSPLERMGLLAGRYKRIAELGIGGFGQTFLAQDMQQPDALSCVIKQFKPTNQEPQFLAIARRLFDTEVETLRKLGQHDQIPALLNFFEEDNEFYLVQEFIDGETLSEEFARRGPYLEAEAIDLLQDLLSVLEFVHSQHVIHRDIKPGNLIRRGSDGKIVLIDFGAVKEIQTQILQQAGQSSFTVGIGTQGYTPAEQLAGKPRYCSDLYALGMTAIHALTGYQPSVLPEDPDTGELLWQSDAQVSWGLAIVLNRLVRLQARERYQSASEVQRALQHLADLPTELTSIPSILLPQGEQDKAEEAIETALVAPKRRWGGVAIATLAIAGFVLSGRQLGWLEPLELAVFDQLVRLQPQMPPDARLTLVEITETDLQQIQRTTPTDRELAQAIANLQQHQPAVIGLDLHRDIPQAPGEAELAQQLQAENLVAITNLGTSNTDRIPPPSGVPIDRIGFNDMPLDSDGVARRALLFATPPDGATYYSFALRVALQYLDRQKIKPRSNPEMPDYLQIGATTFVPLQPTAGGYQQADTAGYQILLRYRSIEVVAHRLTLTEVLSDRIDPNQIKNQIVLIGTRLQAPKICLPRPTVRADRAIFRWQA